jgi:mRNA interferase MazF
VYSKGNVVTVDFPFTDKSGSKVRPALVISDEIGSNVIICPITSSIPRNEFGVFLGINDMSNGSLQRDSYIRPDKVYTVDTSFLLKCVGTITAAKKSEVYSVLINIFKV